MGSIVFRKIVKEGYEEVIEVKEATSGLHAIIALHDLRLGPALGGTRAWPYKTVEEALTDALRLAKGMTDKAAIAQTGTGGGKSVILTGHLPGQKLTPEVLHAFAEAVDTLKGRYICAEDVGVSVDHLIHVCQKTPYVVGLAHPKSSGDPSRFTAWGGLQGIRAVAKKLWGTTGLEGKKIAIQGLGAVGMKLADLLFWEGAELIVADVVKEKVDWAIAQFGATGVSCETIHSVSCDIFVPCALGGILNAKTILELRCKAVAGLANNQLLEPQDGERLFKRNILYAPDFIINSGGLLNVCTEIVPQGYRPDTARKAIRRIFDHLVELFEHAEKAGISPAQAAESIVGRNLSHGIGKRTTPPIFHHHQP